MAEMIHGNWRAGYALGFHTISSRPLPYGGFDTEYTELGEMVNQVKYQKDRSKIQPLAEIAAKFLKEEFVIDARPLHRKLNVVIPIPPSDTNRPFQPVPEIAEKIGSLLNRPVRTDYLIKEKQTRLLKSIPDVESRQAEIQGAFVVPCQDLK
jgi:predicted amidophosphoribosyltransferase